MIPTPRGSLPFGACAYCAGDDEHAPHCADVVEDVAIERQKHGGVPRVVPTHKTTHQEGLDT